MYQSAFVQEREDLDYPRFAGGKRYQQEYTPDQSVYLTPRYEGWTSSLSTNAGQEARKGGRRTKRALFHRVITKNVYAIKIYRPKGGEMKKRFPKGARYYASYKVMPLSMVYEGIYKGKIDVSRPSQTALIKSDITTVKKGKHGVKYVSASRNAQGRFQYYDMGMNFGKSGGAISPREQPYRRVAYY